MKVVEIHVGARLTIALQPEYPLSHVLNLLTAHERFLKEEVQGILDANGFREVSAMVSRRAALTPWVNNSFPSFRRTNSRLCCFRHSPHGSSTTCLNCWTCRRYWPTPCSNCSSSMKFSDDASTDREGSRGNGRDSATSYSARRNGTRDGSKENETVSRKQR